MPPHKYFIHVCLLHLCQALLQAISNAGGREDIIEPAMCALRHITSRHPSADMAQNAIRHVGGIPVVATFLHQQCRWPLLKVYMYIVHVRLYKFFACTFHKHTCTCTIVQLFCMHISQTYMYMYIVCVQHAHM